MRKLTERKVYERWDDERVQRETIDLSLCQHVALTFKGKAAKGWVHRLNPVYVEVKIYGGPMRRFRPFDLTVLETFHW